MRIAGAGVGHRRSEHPLVERVGHVVVVMDRFGVASLAVPQAFCDTTPPGQRLLRRRRDRQEVLEADGAHDVGHHPRRRPLELQLVGQRLEQLVRVAGVHAVRFEVAGHVGPRQPEIAGGGGEVRGAARGPQVQAELGVVGSGAAAVVRGELQRHPACGEDLEDLGERQLAWSCARACSLNVVIVVAPPSRRGRGVVSRDRRSSSRSCRSRRHRGRRTHPAE